MYRDYVAQTWTKEDWDALAEDPSPVSILS